MNVNNYVLPTLIALLLTGLKELQIPPNMNVGCVPILPMLIENLILISYLQQTLMRFNHEISGKVDGN
jgi:hypothetical protein